MKDASMEDVIEALLHKLTPLLKHLKMVIKLKFLKVVLTFQVACANVYLS